VENLGLETMLSSALYVNEQQTE